MPIDPQPESQEPHQHRSVDEHGNPDDKMSEKEALAQAASEGIYFKDSYSIVGLGDFSNSATESFDTKQEAEEKRLQMDDAENYHVVQVRNRIQPEDN